MRDLKVCYQKKNCEQLRDIQSILYNKIIVNHHMVAVVCFVCCTVDCKLCIISSEQENVHKMIFFAKSDKLFLRITTPSQRYKRPCMLGLFHNDAIQNVSTLYGGQ